jgi:hypothetical protein
MSLKLDDPIGLYFALNLSNRWNVFRSFNEKTNFDDCFIIMYFFEIHLKNKFKDLNFFKLMGQVKCLGLTKI